MKQGNIGVTTENIFPVIKKFLYSDHEIFIREIVSNAVDATQKLKTLAGKGDFKGEMGDLKIRVSIDKDAKTITVSDNGQGIPPAILEEIFKPFYTTKTKGTGIGLSLCRQIILQHDGVLTVESQEGKGTTFCIKL